MYVQVLALPHTPSGTADKPLNLRTPASHLANEGSLTHRFSEDQFFSICEKQH